ncbi:MAG: ATP-binding protein [Myxococcota bacterium]
MSEHLLLIGGSDDDARGARDALARASRDVTVHRAAGLEDARGRLPSLPPLCCVLVNLDATSAPAHAWVALLREARRSDTPLVALAGLEQEADVTRFLAEGADDWVFRPQLAGFPAALVRLERDRARREAQAAGERRLRESTAELVALTRSPRFRGDDLEGALKEVTEAGVRGLAVARCSVWLLDDARASLVMADGFDARTKAHQTGHKLAVAEHRGYFDALAKDRLLAVEDARHHPSMRVLRASYFEPEGITSTLDVVVRLRGDLVGVLCLEHAGPPRRWHAGEEAFAGALADVVSLALEAAQRSRVESALLQSERRFRDIFQFSNDCIILYRVALDGSVFCEDINAATEAVTGLRRDEVIGRQAHEVLAQGSADKLKERYAQCIRARAPIIYEHSLELPTGVKWFNTAIVPLLDEQGRVQRLAAVARDVTQQREAETLQRQMEGRLAEAQKSEALGRVASHIAHDFNNLLTVVAAHAQRLADVPGRPAEVSQAILQATSRGRELAQQLLTFGRRGPVERRSLDVAPLVRETLKLLEPTAPKVTFRAEVPMRPVRVLGDSGQLHQVLTNLGSNALQAMAGGGTLTVRLEVVDVDYAFAAAHPPLQAGRWARLSVVDTGQGMDEATRKRIFEPFFTRRADGQGTGLGLAVVQSIVSGHDGAVLVESAPGQGSAFHVYLPLLEEDVDRPGAGQHLMLVDDHPGMARVSARLLETLGYRTSVFDDPRDALEAFKATPSGYDAVLTDLSMPQMSGEEFTKSVRAVRPTVPVIVSSGLVGSLDSAELQRLGINAVLVKPWRLEEAVATLQRVLPTP